MDTTDEPIFRSCRFCGIAAFVLCVLHVAAIGVFDYRHLLKVDWLDWSEGNIKELVINGGIWLSPIAVVILTRRYAVGLWLCAAPIILNLSMQTYYAWLFLTTGTNPGVRQKGDWVTWLPTFMGMLAVMVAATWIFVLVLNAVSKLAIKLTATRQRRAP